MNEPVAIPAGVFRRAAHGVRLPLRALVLLARNPSLWPLALAPVLLTAAGLAVGVIFGWYASRHLLALAWAPPAHALLAALWQLAHFVLDVVLVLLSALIPPLVLAAPFNDQLSASVEALTLGTAVRDAGLGRALHEVMTSVVNALARLIRFGAVQALLFGVSFVPVVGAAYPLLAFAWSAVWLAEQSLDQTAARHLMSWRDARVALAAVRPTGAAMGVVLGAVFLVPLANIFLVPLATVSGALLYGDLQRSAVLSQPADARPAPLGGS